MEFKMNMQKLADELGVSKVTVHKALNNYDGVSKELRQKILNLARESGYVLPRRKLKRGQTFLFVVDKIYFLKINEQYYTTIHEKLGSALIREGCKLETVFFDKMKPDEARIQVNKFLAAAGEKQIGGIFAVGEQSRELMDFYSGLDENILCVDFFFPNYELNYLYFDNYYNSFNLVSHLVKKGHRKIAFIGDVRQSSAIVDRFLGYRKALYANRINYEKCWKINEISAQQHNIVFEIPEIPPTAYVCHCDATAVSLCQALNFLKIRVPEEVSVASFDNTEVCLDVKPRLTSIGVDKDDYVEQMIDCMVDIKLNRRRSSAQKVKVKLFERDSVDTVNPLANRIS